MLWASNRVTRWTASRFLHLFIARYETGVPLSLYVEVPNYAMLTRGITRPNGCTQTLKSSSDARRCYVDFYMYCLQLRLCG